MTNCNRWMSVGCWAGDRVSDAKLSLALVGQLLDRFPYAIATLKISKTLGNDFLIANQNRCNIRMTYFHQIGLNGAFLMITNIIG
jgi:hypothetical protein